jgi:hypothetical protein
MWGAGRNRPCGRLSCRNIAIALTALGKGEQTAQAYAIACLQQQFSFHNRCDSMSVVMQVVSFRKLYGHY